MVVEREGNFFESRQAGVPLMRALRGERGWFELTSGTPIDDRTAVKDKDTVVIYKGAWAGSSTAFGQIWYDEVSGGEINQYKFGFFGISIRWRPGMSLGEKERLYFTAQELLAQLRDLRGELEVNPNVAIARVQPLVDQAEEFLSRKQSLLGPKLVDKGNVKHRTLHY